MDITMRMFKQVMEIRSRVGVLHFKRWAIIECEWFNIYIHYIGHSDMDRHPHNHPWKFTSMVLKGGYVESKRMGLLDQVSIVPRVFFVKFRSVALPFDIRRNNDLSTYHKIRLIKPTYTLVFTGPRINNDWGYLVDGKHIDAEEYRRTKHAHSKS